MVATVATAPMVVLVVRAAMPVPAAESSDARAMAAMAVTRAPRAMAATAAPAVAMVVMEETLGHPVSAGPRVSRLHLIRVQEVLATASRGARNIPRVNRNSP
jgi:hypothetical protein